MDRDLWGLSTHIDIHGCNPSKIKSAESIKEYVTQLCTLLKVKMWGEMTLVHFGTNDTISGYSLVQLIETSSITGHFVDKSSSAYIDIFSCLIYEHKIAVDFTKKFFEAQSISYNVIERKHS